jgi:UDP-sugar transporter A1/2/3
MAWCDAKYGVLVLLVVQNTCLVLLMRYSRTRPGTMYLGSTAVCCDEALKLVTCFGILAVTYLRRKGTEGGGYSPLRTGTEDDDEEEDDGNSAGEQQEADDDIPEGSRRHDSFRSYLGAELQFDFRMAGIAAIYTVQKNLLYLGISNLDAAVFQVTYQAKILTTAVFSMLLLQRTLSYQKIAGLMLLTLGVALVQVSALLIPRVPSVAVVV